MSVIFLGFIYPPGFIDKLKAAGSSIDFAAETFQTSLLQGLCEYYPNLKVITAPNVNAYPTINIKKFDEFEFLLPYSNETHIFTGFSNISYLKMFSKMVRVRKTVKTVLDEGNNNTIIIYAAHSPFLLALCGINRRRYKSCLIVPDLPNFMSESTNILRKIAKKIDGLLIRYALKYIDSFVLFSPYMREYLPTKNKKWIHLEGVFNSKNEYKQHFTKEKEKVILYTGNLSERTGIKDLLIAFSLIPNTNYRLWIRGDGNCINDVKEATRKDNRIKYIEPLSKEELLRLQKEATLLINPVYSSQKFTRYFFPSKTMEYLASGTPTLMSKLACLPQTYYSHLYFFDDESIEGMKNKIIEICEKPQDELDAFGKAASEFILKEKNEKVQSKKIVDLIASLK